MNEYEIEMLDNGKADVRRNRKAFAYDMDDMDEALRRIKRIEGKGFEVTLIELDGFRSKVRT